MKLRACLFATLCMWLAFESKFSPSFFMSRVEFSLAELQRGLDSALAIKYPVTIRSPASDEISLSSLD